MRYLPQNCRDRAGEQLRKQVFQQILIAALPPVVRQNGTPRAVAPLVPMGANAGEPNNVEQQTQILEATLEQLVKIPSAGKIVPLPFEYIAHV